ncbi:hypothetical protein [Kordia sp.]|uniref:hypothetical protein n=1 Tax=Kordia sp. TaxID=1965332 RepID=UPI003B5A3D1D
MSLLVCAYVFVPETNTTVAINEQPKAPFNNLFGFESWRQTVWDSPILRKHNCTLLNSLSSQDIYAGDAVLLQLQNELEVIKEHIDQITDELNLHKESFAFRIDNAFEAIRIAQKVTNGIVYIG